MKVAEVDSIGQGRVWSGEDAQKIGLVDVLGGLETTIGFAAKKTGLKNYGIKTFPEKDKMEMIIENLISETKTSLIKGELGSSYIYYKRLKDVQNIEGIQTRLPYFLDIK
jgi:protease-4